MTTRDGPGLVQPSEPNGDADARAQLRQRKTTFASGADGRDGSPAGAPPLNRRTSSFLTTSSLDSARLSTDDLFSPRFTGQQDEFHQETTLWHSLPLLFALLPALGGVWSKSISRFITDFVLLSMAAIYLNWCLVTPWTWYHAAQAVKVAGVPTQQDVFEEAVVDEQDESEGATPANGLNGKAAGQQHERDGSRTEAAVSELRIHESTALVLCILGPLIGSYLLHIIRLQLSRFGDELVSNLHLTLFVLVAELRPLRHLMKMLHSRTIHLQRIVRDDPHATEKFDVAQISDLRSRIDELEANVASSTQKAVAAPATPLESLEPLRKGQSALQSQIDALNRAVRRYEKRATAQTIQTESRLQDLESRLKDALSLAAAAVHSSRQQGPVTVLLSWSSRIFVTPLLALWTAVVYPFHAAGRVVADVMVRLGLARVEPRTRPAARPGVRVRSGRDGVPSRQKRAGF